MRGRSALACALVLGLGPTSRAQEPSAPAADAALASITAADLRTHLAALADDAMAGRDQAGGGIGRAAEYVAAAMARLGLRPAPGATDHFQIFTLGRLRLDPERLALRRGEARVGLTDGLLPLSAADGTWRLPAVWAPALATGGPAPEAVRGACACVPIATPFEDEGSRAAAETLAAAARAAGAAACLVVAASDTDADCFEAAGRRMARGRPASSGDLTRAPAFVACWCDPRAFTAIFGDVGASARAAAADAAPAPLGEIVFECAATLERAQEWRNVLGWIPGTDPARRDEVVVLSAHYDHIGTRPGGAPDADTIFNGADDDASGVATILEMAQAFAQAPPARSILVAAFTGEELGLVGSRHFAEHPPVPLARIVAGVNVEMVGRPAAHGPGGMWITGHAFSSFGTIVRDAAAPLGVTVLPDPYPEQGFFFRSDNVSLARHGVPAHTCSTFDPLTHHDYHGVDDEVDRIDFANLEVVARGIFAGARAIAAGTATPAWAADAPFRRAGDGGK